MSAIHSKSYLKALFVVLLLLASFTVIISNGAESDTLRRQITTEPSETILQRGRDYYRANHPDSALMVFNYLSDGYSDKLSPEDKRISILAKNNVGLIYAFSYMDYRHGYEVLTDAFELAEKCGLSSTQAVMCINLVELLRLYSICLQSENVNDRIDHYLSVGIEKAMESQEYRALASLIINSIEQKPTMPLDKLKVIEDPQIPDSIEGVSYARACIKVAEALQQEKYDDARRILKAAYQNIPGFSYSGVEELGHRMLMARISVEEGKPHEAVALAKRVSEMADSLGTLQNKLIATSFLASLPVSGRESFQREFMDTKDSALSKGQLHMVNEIDFRRSLNHELAENRRLSQERSRLFWGLGIGGALLIIFGILIGLLIHNRRILKERNSFLYAKIQERMEQEKQNSKIAEKKESAEESTGDTSKYAGSSLSNEKMDELQESLTATLSDENVVCDSDLSLAKMASKLNVNTTYLSRVVNERFGKSFSALLNEYRVRIATARMGKESPYANQTIEAIAHSVGYTSRSSFITAFKKINGMTPSEYMKMTME